jgi:hypothetical protein
MGLPVVANTPTNNLINGTTSGTQSRTPGAGETAIVLGSTTSGGGSVSVSGAGGTWTQIVSVSDGTRTSFIYRGDNITSGTSQTVTVSFSNNTTCRWTWVAATGMSTSTPNDQNGSKATASSTRTASDCVSTAVTTPPNVLCVATMAFSATPSTINAPTSWTRVTAGSGTTLFNAYYAVAAGLSSDSITVTHGSVATATQGAFASFNGDDQGAAGGPSPHYVRRRLSGGMVYSRGGV